MSQFLGKHAYIDDSFDGVEYIVKSPQFAPRHESLSHPPKDARRILCDTGLVCTKRIHTDLCNCIAQLIKAWLCTELPLARHEKTWKMQICLCVAQQLAAFIFPACL